MLPSPIRVTLVAMMALTLSYTVSAHPEQPRPGLNPILPQLSAQAYILIDYHSGKVIAEHRADEPVEPASLTKMMTVYLADRHLQDGHISLEDRVRVSEHAWRQEGARMFIKEGSYVTVDELLHGVVIQSGNDASVALAEHISGTEDQFVDLMNAQAAWLGLEHTHFSNANGMPDPNHLTTTRDLATLARAVIADFPERYPLYAQKAYTYNNIKQNNRNRLLWRDSTVDGIKTGNTDHAGFCIAASAKRNNMRLIAVVMGSKSDEQRTADTQKLLNYGFRYFETHQLYASSMAISQQRVWLGKQPEVSMGIESDVFVTIQKGKYQDLKIHLQVPANLEAPIQKGSQLGQLQVSLGEDVLVEVPVLALESVERGGFWQRMKDRLYRILAKWFG